MNLIRASGMAFIVSSTALLCFSAQSQSGWESLTDSELIPRSERIVVGTLYHRGRPDAEGMIRAELRVYEWIYTGVGETDTIDLMIASETVPGSTYAWPNRHEGVWFILEHDDRYAPVNHPSCWAEESEAQKISASVSSSLNSAYRGMLSSITEANEKYPDADQSDSSSSVEAYSELTRIVNAYAAVPSQDEAHHSAQTYSMVMGLLDAAGVQTGLPTHVSSPESEDALYERLSAFVPGGGSSLSDDPAERASQVTQAQHAATDLGLKLLGATMGAGDPSSEIAEVSRSLQGVLGRGSPDTDGEARRGLRRGPARDAERGPRRGPIDALSGFNPTGTRQQMLQQAFDRLVAN